MIALTVKEWFSRARKLDAHIDSLLETRERLYARATSIVAQLSGVVVDGTKDPHKFDALVVMKNMIDTEVDKLYDIKQEILSVILAMPDNTEQEKTYRDLLQKRYVDCLKWENIAVEMNYDYIYVKGALHGNALHAAEPYITKDTE